MFHTMGALPSGDVFVIGGRGRSGLDIVNDVYKSTDDGATWTLVEPSTSFSLPRHGHGTVTTIDGELVVFGGRSATAMLPDVWTSRDGVAWTQAATTASFGTRMYFATTVVPGSGVVMLAGGSVTGNPLAPGSLRSDVWTWHPGSDMSAWAQQTAGAGWSPRWGHSLAALNNGSVILVAGLTNVSTPLSDVWLSSDLGSTWQRRTHAAEFGGRGRSQIVAVPGTMHVLLFGGQLDSDPYMSDLWRSIDLGAHWELLLESGSAPGRDAFASVLTESGVWLFSAGANTDALQDVWAVTWGWRDSDCEAERPALCRAESTVTTVEVSLPSGAGSVAPANAASNTLAVTYEPPVIAVAGTVDTTPLSVLAFDVSSSSPLSALDASAFTVNAGHLPVTHVQLSGAADTWELAVHVQGGTLAGCPPGYTVGAVGETTFCGRAIETSRPWSMQAEACGGLGLASPSSAEEMQFFGSLRADSTQSYWYVAPGSFRVPPT